MKYALELPLYFTLFVAYGSHALTVFNRVTLLKSLALGAITLLPLCLLIAIFSIHDEMANPQMQSFWLFEYASHVGPLVLLTGVVLITRRGALQLAWDIGRWTWARLRSSKTDNA